MCIWYIFRLKAHSRTSGNRKIGIRSVQCETFEILRLNRHSALGRTKPAGCCVVPSFLIIFSASRSYVDIILLIIFMELITIRTFQNYFPAHIILTKLRSAGIECYLKDEATVTIGPFLSNAIGGVKLVVRKSDEAEVLDMLKCFDDEYRNNAACPKCGSHSIELVPKKTSANLLTALISWMFGNLALTSNVYQCAHCGYESESLPESFYSSGTFGPEQLN